MTIRICTKSIFVVVAARDGGVRHATAVAASLAAEPRMRREVLRIAKTVASMP